MPQSREIMASGQRKVDCFWFQPSLFASFVIMMFINTSCTFFTYPCRWLVERGEWAFALVTGPLFLINLWILVALNIKNPGIVHRGTMEQDPEAGHTAWMFSHAFQMPWCEHCEFHQPPRTLHCASCNMCVEEYDHHSRWVNNCIGHRNFRLFLLLLVSLFMYLVAMVVSCVTFLERSNNMPLSMEKIVALIVAVLATGALLPVIFELLVQHVAVSTAKRLYEVQDNNPFNQGCIRNWHVTLCAPLGPKYMADVVLLQQDSGSKCEPMTALQAPTFSMTPHRPDLPGPDHQPVCSDTSYEGPPGSTVI